MSQRGWESSCLRSSSFSVSRRLIQKAKASTKKPWESFWEAIFLSEKVSEPSPLLYAHPSSLHLPTSEKSVCVCVCWGPRSEPASSSSAWPLRCPTQMLRGSLLRLSQLLSPLSPPHTEPGISGERRQTGQQRCNCKIHWGFRLSREEGQGTGEKVVWETVLFATISLLLWGVFLPDKLPLPSLLPRTCVRGQEASGRTEQEVPIRLLGLPSPRTGPLQSTDNDSGINWRHAVAGFGFGWLILFLQLRSSYYFGDSL